METRLESCSDEEVLQLTLTKSFQPEQAKKKAMYLQVGGGHLFLVGLFDFDYDDDGGGEHAVVDEKRNAIWTAGQHNPGKIHLVLD